MDPNTLLMEIRAALKAADNSTSLAARNLQWEVAANKFRDLDTWLAGGGFPPSAWRP